MSYDEYWKAPQHHFRKFENEQVGPEAGVLTKSLQIGAGCVLPRPAGGRVNAESLETCSPTLLCGLSDTPEIAGAQIDPRAYGANLELTRSSSSCTFKDGPFCCARAKKLAKARTKSSCGKRCKYTARL